ncbi:MAG: alkaline phosphatase family protein [Nitrososphaerota archaeon]
MVKKIAVIGLDSVPPSLLFDRLIDKLPNFRHLYESGLHGNLLSCDPPITVPAWMVMMTGKNPGKLGIYGFRHRKPGTYSDGYIVNSTHVKEETVWDVLSREGKKSIVLGVPPSYPPKPLKNGIVVSCFLTPNKDRSFTYPEELRKEILEITGGRYEFDVTFRTEDRDVLKQELFAMTEARLDVALYLVNNKQWDFFMMHEIGFDRLHHAFWKFFDPAHPKYVKGNKYEHIAEEYYSMFDQRLGKLMSSFPKDTITFILSDHGSKAMKGAFCVNQWLEREGYLRLRTRPKAQLDLGKADIDWSRTKAWGWGGYYARIFFNVKGREPNGTISPSDLENEKKKLTQKIMSISDGNGRAMVNKVFEPDKLYGKAIGDKPDLMVYFDDLNWRSAGTVGHDSLYLSENDTGPDDSVHSMDGVFMMYVPGRDLGGKKIEGLRIEDIGPTILKLYGLAYSGGPVDGRVIPEVLEACG